MLLAKPNESLIAHTESSLKVFASIKEAYPEIPDLCGINDFWENLFYAIFLHDFGKSASGFQEELRTNKKWNYRHEILSAGLVSALDTSEENRKSIALAIITHHKDILELREKYATYPRTNPGYSIFCKKLKELNLGELNKLLDYIPTFSFKYLGKKLTNYHYINSYENIIDVYSKYVLSYYRDYKLGKFTPLHRNYGIFMKGFLTACDHLSSAGVEEIKKSIKDINRYINFNKLTSVQEKCRKHKGDLFVISPTGSGKTEAALFWAHKNQNKSNTKRIFYILPYTASINYMYKRFINTFGGNELVCILHGKSSYFLYKFLAEGKEDIDYQQVKKKVIDYQSMARKIYKPYKIMTPFQIIKAFFNLKGFEQNISEMVGGLFIFDEIHSYDPHTTALILQISKFIKEELGGKLLFMTATMPSFLKEIFQEELKILDEIKMDKEELNKFTRHRLNILNGNIIDSIKLIKNDIERGKKVLVVANTVSQAQAIFKKLERLVPNSALLHSRFILRDREAIESSLGNKNLLVGTQVIEVSLDIDYDVLYSEPAPIDVLLQRFGRVNRKGEKGIATVHVFSEGSGIGESGISVYDKGRTKKSIDYLKEVGILRESTIQDIIDYVYENGYSEKELKIFENISKSFWEFFRNNVPFIDLNKSESDFYSLFNSVEVIPYKFWNNYKQEIEEKKYFEAMKYILPISLAQYHYLKDEKRLSITEEGIIIDSEYNDKIGLLIKAPFSFGFF